MFVDSYVLSVPEDKKEEYTKLAKIYAEVAAEHGVLEVCENWEAEVPDGKLTDFRKAVQAQPGEKIVVSWVVWPDQETSKKAHDTMFKDPRFAEFTEMPFDGKRMIIGSFEPISSYRRSMN